MKRFLMVLALAGAMIGCGDDDGDDEGPDAGKPDAAVDAAVGIDAARPDSGTDAAPAAPKVTNAGALCSSASTCTPSGATCDTMTQFGVASPGFCSATCTKASDCGDTGDCPVGELVNGALGASFKMGGFPNVTVGQCYAKCAAVGSQSTCQTGFTCSNLKTAFAMPAAADAAGAVITRGICIPNGGLIPRPAGDGGVGDGGIRTDGGANVADAGGIDSGT